MGNIRTGFLGLGIIALLLVGTGCGSSHPATQKVITTSPSPTVKPAATPTPSPTPVPSPDNEDVAVVAQGFGSYGAILLPVVIVKNEATWHSAMGVQASFTTFDGSGNGSLPVTSDEVNLAPGASVALAGDCTRGCPGAVKMTVSVVVNNGWDTKSVVSFLPIPGQIGGDVGVVGENQVTGTLQSSASYDGNVVVTAVAYNRAGNIAGGAEVVTEWTGMSGSPSLNTISLTTPSSVEIYAAPLG